jgi:hypothetical protein
LINVCARLRPGQDVTDPAVTVKVALRRLARRWIALDEEINQLDDDLALHSSQRLPPPC